MKTIKKKNQKPIEHDIHLKYRCSKCGQDHWLSFQEASTKNFKIVCYCGKVFQVKRVLSFKIKYEQDNTKQTFQEQSQNNQTEAPQTKPSPVEIPIDTLKNGVKILVGYGFTPEEASTLLKKTFENNKSLELVALIKKSLESLKGQL